MLQIETLPVESLIPYVRNARTHSDAQVAQIAGSIREFGFTNPVLIDATGGIIAGHGRVMAARKLGLETVPCLRLGHLSEVQKRAYILADNKLALNAGWDEAMLAEELQALQVDGFDISLTGFNGVEIDEVVNLPERITQKKEDLVAIKMTRILVSIPTVAASKHAGSMSEIIKQLMAIGAEIDQGGN